MAWGPGYPAEPIYQLRDVVRRLHIQYRCRYPVWLGRNHTMDNNAPIHSGVLTSYSYTTAGEALTVGQRAIPEPGALGLLALGGIGLATWRRKRNQAA